MAHIGLSRSDESQAGGRPIRTSDLEVTCALPDERYDTLRSRCGRRRTLFGFSSSQQENRYAELTRGDLQGLGTLLVLAYWIYQLLIAP